MAVTHEFDQKVLSASALLGVLLRNLACLPPGKFVSPVFRPIVLGTVGADSSYFENTKVLVPVHDLDRSSRF